MLTTQIKTLEKVLTKTLWNLLKHVKPPTPMKHVQYNEIQVKFHGFYGNMQKIWTMAIIHVGEIWKTKREIHLNIFWNNNTKSSNDHLLKEIYILKHDPPIANQIIKTWGYNMCCRWNLQQTCQGFFLWVHYEI